MSDAPPLTGRGVWTVVNLLQTATLLREELETALAAEAGLSLAEHDAMMQLLHHEGRLPMSDLADLVLFTQSGITRLVDRLEERRLVRRETSPDDRRVVHATLTRRGAERLRRRAMRAVERVVDERFNRHVSTPDAAELRRILLSVLRGNGWTDERQRTHEP